MALTTRLETQHRPPEAPISEQPQPACVCAHIAPQLAATLRSQV